MKINERELCELMEKTGCTERGNCFSKDLRVHPFAVPGKRSRNRMLSQGFLLCIFVYVWGNHVLQLLFDSSFLREANIGPRMKIMS